MLPWACGGEPTNPTPSPSPSVSPTYTAQPNATAFENLQMISDLERKSGRNSILVRISTAGTEPSGRITPVAGSGWDYDFAEAATQRQTFFRWELRPSG